MKSLTEYIAEHVEMQEHIEAGADIETLQGIANHLTQQLLDALTTLKDHPQSDQPLYRKFKASAARVQGRLKERTAELASKP